MPSTATPLWARATSSVTTARPPISHSGSSGDHCTVIAFIAPPPSLGQRSLIRRSLTQLLQDEGHVHLVGLEVTGQRVHHEVDAEAIGHHALAPHVRPHCIQREANLIHCPGA